MKKIILLIIVCSASLSSMQSEQAKQEAACTCWGKYLLRAAQATQVDAAMVHQIAANMRRDKCEGAKGPLARKHMQAFVKAQAKVSCPQGFNWPPVNAFPFSLTSPEPEDPHQTCYFEFKNQ